MNENIKVPPRSSLVDSNEVCDKKNFQFLGNLETEQKLFRQRLKGKADKLRKILQHNSKTLPLIIEHECFFYIDTGW